MDNYLSSVFLYGKLSLLFLWGLFTITFVIAVWRNLWKILDIVWGLGFVSVATIGWGLFTQFRFSIHFIILFLVCLWGLRLSLYIGIKRFSLQEDPRYIALKQKSSLLKSYIFVFLSQAFFTWIMCIPFYFYFPISSSLLLLPINNITLFLGVLIAIMGLFWEWKADYQLILFKQPKKLVNKGLWAYSRHPNYFGEISFWWGIWLATLTLQVPFMEQSYGLKSLFIGLSILSPLTITLVISYITGPMLEKEMLKYPQWEEYKKKTPYIIPRFYF